VPITVPYFPPELVYRYTAPSDDISPLTLVSPGDPTSISLEEDVMSLA